MSRALVIGASGLVGSHILAQLKTQNIPAIGTYRSTPQAGLTRLEVFDSGALTMLIREHQPEVIYLPASLTNVDYCEQHPDESYQTNVLGVMNVVKVAAAAGIKVVYFSSDYVFDGRDGPYSESAPPNPISVYGTHKVLAEHITGFNAPAPLVIRTTVVYGWEQQGKNFIYRLRRTLQAGQPLTVPADQVGSPTYAPDLAAAVIALVAQGVTGIVNVAGRERASRYEFALTAAQVFGLDESLIQPVTTAQLKQAAQRPLNAGMYVDKAEMLLNRPLLDHHQGLRLMAEMEPNR